MSYASKVIEGLLSPTMGQNMAQLGAAIGGIPGQIKEQQEEKEELARFNQISTVTQAGIKASQDGNLTDLDSQIQKLNELRNSPGLTTDQLNFISRQSIELIKLRDDAKTNASENEYRELVNLESELNNPNSSLTSSERLVKKAKLDKLKQNPNLVEKLQQFKLNKFNYDEALETRQADQWLDQNRTSINTFIQNGDLDGLESFISEAGEYTEDAQAYADRAIESQETKNEFKKRLADAKRAPELDLYQDQFDLIPDTPEYSTLKKNLKPLLDLYKEAAEKWNPETQTWEGGLAAKNKAITIENKIQERLTEAMDIVNTGSVAEFRSEKQLLKKQIFQAELALESASTLTTAEISSARQTVAARYASLKDKDKPSPEEFAKEVAEEEEKIIREKVRSATQILTYLKNYGKDTPVDEGDEDTLESPEAIISEAMKDNPDRTRKEIIEQLIRIGDLPINFIEEESLSEKPRYSFPTGYGTSIERLSKPAEITAANVSSTGY